MRNDTWFWAGMFSLFMSWLLMQAERYMKDKRDRNGATTLAVVMFLVGSGCIIYDLYVARTQ
jgi:hypothetical protein